MKSIRFFLISVILSTITLVSFYSALHGYQDSITRAEQLFDSELIDKAQLLFIALNVNEPDKKKKPLLAPMKLDLFDSFEQGDFFAFQIWENGQLFLQSEPPLDIPVDKIKSGLQTINFAKRRWRVFSFQDQALNRKIITAERTDIRFNLAESIVLQTIIPMVIILPFLGLLTGIIITYGLLPLKRLSENLGRKRIDDLSPIPDDKQPEELVQVVRSINSLLDRLRSAFLREKHFASDAAHELRTPISAIKIHLHNLRKTVADDNQSFIQLESSVDRMGHLVEQILNLSRTSVEQFTEKLETVDLFTLTQDYIAREYHQFDVKNQTIELRGDHCPVTGNQFALDIMVQNLIGNASKYTPEGGSVLVSINESEVKGIRQVEFCVHDSGPGVPESQYERLFDRFYRMDGDRHASGILGCGLGLAIVKQIVDLHQAKISVNTSPILNGLLVKVNFPKQVSHEKS
jgi:two-component system sensor histidine kinase QseC